MLGRKTAPASTPSPVESAIDAGLSYVTGRDLTISRRGSGKAFSYYDPSGKRIVEAAVLERIRSLVIPPNWKNVRICRNPNGHLQATGRDAKNRKQYRYHPRYRRVREETKYQKMLLFGRKLPAIRRKVEQDLGLPGLPKDKVLATVVRLMDLAHIRVGNEEYARQNQSFGLTTLRDRHVAIEGPTLHFEFKGKSGKRHSIDLRDKRLATIVKGCRDLPGYELFQYVDENGEHVKLDSGMVNQYLREIAGEDITAKDFRTWHGTVRAAEELGACSEARSEAEIKRNIVAAIRGVAEHLGNRAATRRKYYIHPTILELYGRGELANYMSKKSHGINQAGLASTEKCVLQILLQNTPH